MFDRIILDLPHAPDPEEALERLHGVPGRVLLHSAGSGGGATFLAADPLEVVRIVEEEDAFAALERLSWKWGREAEGRGTRSATGGHSDSGPGPHPDNFPFAGGIVGFLTYEAGDVLERLPQPPADDVGIPIGWLGVYECGLVWDARTGVAQIAGTLLPGRSEEWLRNSMEELARRVMGGADTDRALGNAVAGQIDPGVWGDAMASGEADGARGDTIAGQVSSSLSREAFQRGVERIREYILAGDLFQANLTRRISARISCTGTEFYRRLLRVSPAPYAAYLDCGDFEITSISPELFLSLRGRAVRTSPIKGTTRRGSTEAEDEALRNELAQSEKNRAENIMIVDLLRNDLSKVALPGSVSVPILAELETHPTVHHLVSTVTATLAQGAGIGDLLRAAFPGGSITGAPKIRAMEILREIEPVRRGVYTGVIGIFSFEGDADLSIAIRTTTLRNGMAHYGTGGGITLASVPEEEWIETEEKARAFLQALEEE